jgi:hypothetical protein
MPDVARRVSRLLASVAAPLRAGGTVAGPDPREEAAVRGQGSEPVELRPGIAVREQARLAEIERWAWRRMRAMRAFYTHLTVFVGINFLLFLIDSSTSGPIWFYVPFLAWGFLLSLHGLHAYDLLPWTTDGWEQRKVRELVIAKLRAEREFER